LHVLVLGCSHKTAPVDVRERIAVGPAELPAVLRALHDADGCDEVALLSTCNRTELYAAGPHREALVAAAQGALERLAAARGAQPVAAYLYRHEQADAAAHLMRVAAGLDALVVGETQVLGQVREAYRAAQQAGTVGKALHGLFERALAAARRIHRETEIDRHATSVSAAAVELARKIFGDLGRRRALVVGAGETAELVALNLRQSAIGDLVVANRTLDRARALAERLGGRALPLEDVQAALPDVDIVISSTGSSGHLLSARVIGAAAASRRGEPLLVVDIAVPRDVEPAAGRLPGVFLYNVDDLREVVAANLRARARQAQRAERIVLQEAAAFGDWMMSLDVVPTICALREKVEAIRQAELARTLARLPELDERQRRLIEAMSTAITQKILNDPTLRLKELAGGPGAADAVAALRELFRLDPPVPEAGEPLPAPAPQAQAG
jgi:glutamyl-tRNA reductase